MAKKTKKQLHAEKWSSVSNIAASTSSFLKDSLQEMSFEYGDSRICTAGDAGKLVIGLPAPSISFEYLIQNTVFPLQRVTQALGSEGSFKSAWCIEVVRWARKVGGIGALFETEHKYSADFAASILGWDQADCMGCIPSDDMEEWQTKMLDWLKRAKKSMVGTKENPGSGKTWPAILIVDSIMGTLSRNTAADIDKRGFADRRFALEAMKLTDFLKKIPSDLEGWPFALIVVNHLKMSKDDMGRNIRNRAGGKQLSFGETFELEFAKKSINPKILADRRESVVNIRCFKNSLGETSRDIDVPLVWWQERGPDNKMRQITMWDWHASTVDLLTTLEVPGITTQMKDIVDIRRVNSDGIKYWSKTLGIPESDPQSAHEVGKAVCQNTQTRTALRELFGIKTRKRFKPGVDYDDQLRELTAEIDENVAQEEQQPDLILEPDDGEV